MSAMPSPADVPAGVVVPPSALALQAKGQLRLLIAAVAGSLVLRGLLPAWLVNDQTLELATGAAIYGIVAAWQWSRTRLNHLRWWRAAVDPRVPADVAIVKEKTP